MKWEVKVSMCKSAVHSMQHLYFLSDGINRLTYYPKSAPIFCFSWYSFLKNKLFGLLSRSYQSVSSLSFFTFLRCLPFSIYLYFLNLSIQLSFILSVFDGYNIYSQRTSFAKRYRIFSLLHCRVKFHLKNLFAHSTARFSYAKRFYLFLSSTVWPTCKSDSSKS